MKIKTIFSQNPFGHFNQILCVNFYVHGNFHDVGHMTNMAATPIYVKTL